MFGNRKRQMLSEIASLRSQLEACENNERTLQQRCGIGLWSATLSDNASKQSDAAWNWSDECRRLIGAAAKDTSSTNFNVLLDRMAPVGATFVREKFEAFLLNRDFNARLELNCPLQPNDGPAPVLRLICSKESAGNNGEVQIRGVLIDLNGQVEKTPEELKLIETERNGIMALANGLSALAKGDLTHSISIEFHPKAAGLKADFNQTATRLHDMLQSVKQTVRSVRRGADEISSATDSLSKRTETQAASLEETAAALDQITATVTRTAGNTGRVRDVTRNAQQAAEKSGKIIREAVDAMSRIDDSSREIGQIIGVIDEIAFQTNLLALNAGVEAARAGDAGKGFAVVAQEVRELAQRSAKAAKEIKALIATSFKHVGEGVSLVDETGAALQNIVTEISNVAGLINEISSATSEQSAGLHQINIAIRQMDQVTQQNATMVEETSACTMTLAQEAAELLSLTGDFNTSDTGREQTRLRLVG